MAVEDEWAAGEVPRQADLAVRRDWWSQCAGAWTPAGASEQSRDVPQRWDSAGGSLPGAACVLGGLGGTGFSVSDWRSVSWRPRVLPP